MTESTRIAHLAVYDGLADWEFGHLIAELRTGRLTAQPWTVVTVAATSDVVTTMGGVRIEPDLTLAELEPARSELLILPGATLWDAGGGAEFAEAAGRFLDAGVTVAAICGATAGLARAGLLDDRRHTSADPGYLAATGYAGGDHYVPERAVADRGVVTAGPQSPVQFASTTLLSLGLLTPQAADAYDGVFSRADAAAYPVLMSAAGA